MEVFFLLPIIIRCNYFCNAQLKFSNGHISTSYLLQLHIRPLKLAIGVSDYEQCKASMLSTYLLLQA